MKVFVGYDGEIEPVAFHVFSDSIIRGASKPVSITALHLKNMASFYTERHGDGSNAFIYSRFLLPYLCGFQGWALFADGDMVVRDGVDIAELEQYQDDKYAVMVVKHDYRTRHPRKYRGSRNDDYPRKNWSSLVLYNCGHDANRHLTPQRVASESGSFLHRFSWLDDHEIGSLPQEWNRLVLEQDVTADDKLLHYTIGTPCFADYRYCPSAGEWHRAASLAFMHKESE